MSRLLTSNKSVAIALVVTVGLCLFLLAVLVIQILGSSSSPEPLVYVIHPDEDVDTCVQHWTPFVEYLSEELGQPVELIVATDYAAVVEAMRYGHADIASFGPSGYATATREADIEAIVAEVMTSTGLPSYKAYIITRSDSGIESVADLDGKSFAFTDIGSTSGYLVPSTAIVKAGITLEQEYFAGTQFAVIEAVLNGTVDAGSIAEQHYRQALGEGVFGESELDIIYVSDPLPGTVTTVQKSMDSELRAKLVKALLDVPKEIMDATGRGDDISGYASISDADYDVIRDIQDTLGMYE